MSDALAAEDAAIRYADRFRGHRSGQFQGTTAYENARDTCIAVLFARIAEQHQVAPAAVRGAVTDRRTFADAIVVSSFAPLFLFVSTTITRRFAHRSAGPSVNAQIVSILLLATALSAVGVIAGELWSAAFEMLRIGNAHLSYRVNRIPWNRHEGVTFTIAFAVVLAIAAIQHRRVRARESGSQSIDASSFEA